MIEIDPSIGNTLTVKGMNVEDFIERKRGEIEGLIAGAAAIIELDRVGAGLSALNRAVALPKAELIALEPALTGESHITAREMLEASQLVLLELYRVAQAVARAYREGIEITHGRS